MVEEFLLSREQLRMYGLEENSWEKTTVDEQIYCLLKGWVFRGMEEFFEKWRKIFFFRNWWAFRKKKWLRFWKHGLIFGSNHFFRELDQFLEENISFKMNYAKNRSGKHLKFLGDIACSCMDVRIGGFGPPRMRLGTHSHHLMAKGQGESKSLGLSSRA
jgi:hypothetical protein